jgi:hypothetical protein
MARETAGDETHDDPEKAQEDSKGLDGREQVDR